MFLYKYSISKTVDRTRVNKSMNREVLNIICFVDQEESES